MEFLAWEYYTNDQIYYALEVGNSWWIRPRLKNKKLDFVVLFTSAKEHKDRFRNPYADNIEWNILTYTGAWLKGNQSITWSNRRLVEQMENPIPILGFTREGPNKYKFLGFLLLIRYYQDKQIDHEKQLRHVWMFEFQISTDIRTIKVGQFNEIFSSIYQEFRKNILPGDISIDTEIDSPDTKENQRSILSEEKIIQIEELRNRMLSIDPYEFEELMWKLIRHVGFEDVKVTKKSWDEWIDINATLKHKFCIDISYQFQVKRWKHSVWRNEVANLRWSLWFNNSGVIISTSHFTESATKEALAVWKIPVHLIGIWELYDIIETSNFVF